jgi:cytoplasmic iron level regulating protein YaaA (DUF328/UPF0246 family)
MLKILFSPAEGKKAGGELSTQHLFGATQARNELLQAYNAIVQSGDEEQITTLFGIKKFQDCKKYICDIFHAPLMPAIKRYDGVAYEYLNYTQLEKQAQEYLHNNTIIFSNLYGPLLGGDTIPIYKVKQGNTIANIAPEKFYKDRFSYQLDLYLQPHEILDLRAGYYEKFYKTSQPYTTLKFLKNGKTVSHWAKAYRGIVLRECAKHNINTLEAFHTLEIEGLNIHEIQKTKNKTEIIYNIME